MNHNFKNQLFSQQLENQIEHCFERMAILVDEERIEDSKSIYDEYVVDGVEPLEAEFIICKILIKDN